MHKKRLGRGLAALLGTEEGGFEAGSLEQAELLHLAVDVIDPNPFQPRRTFDPNEIAALADSLRQHGMLQPIIVVILILRTSFAFAVFEEILAITQGGPGDATWVAAWYGYKVSFAPPFNIGLGAASAYVLALIVGLLAILYVRFFYRKLS